MKKLLVNTSAVIAGTLTMFPLPVFAQISDPGIEPKPLDIDPGDLAIQIVQTIASWLLGIAGLLAIVYLIWAGIQYITGAGGGADAAKKQIINALIGIIIIVLAYAIVNAATALIGL